MAKSETLQREMLSSIFYSILFIYLFIYIFIFFLWGGGNKYNMIYGLPWISTFYSGDSAMIIVAESPHEWQKTVSILTHILFYFLHAILCPATVHTFAKTITDCSFRHFYQGPSFLTWNCDVTTVQSVKSRERDVLALWPSYSSIVLARANWC